MKLDNNMQIDLLTLHSVGRNCALMAQLRPRSCIEVRTETELRTHGDSCNHLWTCRANEVQIKAPSTGLRLRLSENILEKCNMSLAWDRAGPERSGMMTSTTCVPPSSLRTILPPCLGCGS